MLQKERFAYWKHSVKIKTHCLCEYGILKSQRMTITPCEIIRNNSKVPCCATCIPVNKKPIAARPAYRESCVLWPYDEGEHAIYRKQWAQLLFREKHYVFVDEKRWLGSKHYCHPNQEDLLSSNNKYKTHIV